MKIIISIFTVLILAGLTVTYVKISKPEIQPTSINTEKQKSGSENKKSHFLNFNFNTFNFPARELFIKIDFKKYKNVLLYKVTINTNDEYAIFNIKALLNNENIAYSMIERKKTEIFILFKSLKQANKIIKLFRSYNFNVKIEKIMKRI